MRLIDADELMEHVWRDKLDSRAEIAKMINNAQTVKDIPANVPIDMFDQLMLEKKAKEKELEQKPIDMDMTKALILGLLLGIDKEPDEKDKLREDLVKVFAPEQKIGPWTPISEGLPKEGETVIASTKYGVYPEAKYTKEYGWEWAYEAGMDYWRKFEDVEAWMPLPERYKAESEE